MYQNQQQSQQIELQHLKAGIDRINRHNAEERKRTQLKEIIPAAHFVNPLMEYLMKQNFKLNLKEEFNPT